MAKVRRMKTSTLFRFLVAPALLLCAILRKPIFQWIAVAAGGRYSPQAGKEKPQACADDLSGAWPKPGTQRRREA